MRADFDVHFQVDIKGGVLDRYLANGWYRMGMYIFTTHSLQPDGDEDSYPVYWLRYEVDKVRISKSSRAIIKLNRNFTATVRPLNLTQDLVDLHKVYFDNLTFSAADSLQNLLLDMDGVVFDTYVVEVRDSGRLIAAGIFDKGHETIAGIINFYDPAYKKFGLGKYLVLLKYFYCCQHGIPWYYPGYFSPTYPKFDYKLFLDKGATDVFIKETQVWVRYEEFCQRLGNS